MNTEDEVKISPEKEKSPTSGDDVNFTGVVIDDDEKNDKTIKNERMEEDGILLVVPTKIRGKEFRALIDSGATRCFVTPECCAVGGLSCVPHDTFFRVRKWAEGSFPRSGAGCTDHTGWSDDENRLDCFQFIAQRGHSAWN